VKLFGAPNGLVDSDDFTTWLWAPFEFIGLHAVVYSDGVIAGEFGSQLAAPVLGAHYGVRLARGAVGGHAGAELADAVLGGHAGAELAGAAVGGRLS
jgi:hypothetical protein